MPRGRTARRQAKDSDDENDSRFALKIDDSMDETLNVMSMKGKKKKQKPVGKMQEQKPEESKSDDPINVHVLAKGKGKKKKQKQVQKQADNSEEEAYEHFIEEPNDGNFMEVLDDMSYEQIRHAIDTWDDTKLEGYGLPPNYVRLNKFMETIRQGGNDLHFDNITLGVPGKDLLQGAKLTLTYGVHYGLVGRNGIGKSVLLSHIRDRQLAVPRHLSISMVEQEVPGSEMSALNTVLECDQERQWLLRQEQLMIQEQEQGTGQRRYYALEDIYDRLSQINSDSAMLRAQRILSGLGFVPEDFSKSTSEFSGGWRMRISLARALFMEPDILLLDEPTNHLDLYALLWLENYLTDHWKNTLVVASHERDFLNNVVDGIIHLENCKLHQYVGDYDKFYRALKAERKAEMEKKQGGKGKKDKGDPKLYHQLKPPRFDFPEPLPLGHPIIQFQEASFGYPGKPLLFQRLDFSIDMNSRIGLVGPNGAGKSTLMNLMTGTLEAIGGSITINHKLTVAKFTQHHVDALDLGQTGLEHLMTQHPEIKSQQAYNHLARFGLIGDYPRKPIGSLSGGYKSRITFADLAWSTPQILFLDEPSNHLDIETIDALVKSLNEFKGGIVMISHNTRLLSQVCHQIWVVKDGWVKEYNGSFDEYCDVIVNELIAN